jgi:hypothetical protein
MAKLLLDENPLVIQPSLAAAVGLNEAIAVQQLHYWLNKTDFCLDGRRWVYNTMQEWHKQLFFWSLKTVDRTFKNLVQMGVVLVANYNRSKIDKTLWYSIDYDVLSMLVDNYLSGKNVPEDGKAPPHESESHNNESSNPSGQIDQIEDAKMYVPSGQNDQSIWSSCPIHLVNLGGPIPEITTETTTENISQSVPQSVTDGLKDGAVNQKSTGLLSREKADGVPAQSVSIDQPAGATGKDCLDNIIKNCSLEASFDRDMANAIKMALQNLYFNREFAKNNLKLPLEVVRGRMQNLCGGMIEFAVKKMQRAAAYGTSISSPTNYLQSCIFNAISEYTIFLLSDEYLARLSLDKDQRDMPGTVSDKAAGNKDKDNDVGSCMLKDARSPTCENLVLRMTGGNGYGTDIDGKV